MSVAYILSQAGAKMGLNPADTNERPVLLRFLNEAADELYAQSDMAGSWMEQAFKVNGDQTIALPHDVGNIRAMREYQSLIPWNIQQMRPRYNVSNWNDFWRTFRLKGKQALEKTIDNQSVLTFSTPSLDSTPITITVTGKTPYATSITETITLNAVVVSTTNDWIEVTAINKSNVSVADITVTDIDGTVLAVIPNNEKNSTYQIADVSTCPWLNNSQSKQDHYMEILYKKKLAYLSADGDEFPAQGYDNVVVNKMLQLWFEEQGKIDLAMQYDAKATRSLARKHEEENRATQDTVAFTENTHDNLNPRVRARRPARYGGYSTTQRYGVM